MCVFKQMAEQMDASNTNVDGTVKLAIKTPKEKKDISISASASVQQVQFYDFFFCLLFENRFSFS